MGVPPGNETSVDGQRLLGEKRWQEIAERVAKGESTQADALALLQECERLGRLSLGWRQLVSVWQEYAEGLRQTMLKMSEEIERDVK